MQIAVYSPDDQAPQCLRSLSMRSGAKLMVRSFDAVASVSPELAAQDSLVVAWCDAETDTLKQTALLRALYSRALLIVVCPDPLAQAQALFAAGANDVVNLRSSAFELCERIGMTIFRHGMSLPDDCTPLLPDPDWAHIIDHSMPIGIATLDLDMRVTFVNDAMRELFDLHYNILPEIPSEDVKRISLLYPLVVSAFEGETGQYGGPYRSTLTGRERSVLMTVSPMRSAQGVIDGCVVSVLDVAGEERARVELRRSEERFRALVHSASDMIVVLDRAGRITYINPAVERVLGMAASSFVGRSCLEFIHASREEDAALLFDRVLNGPAAPLGIEFTLHDAKEEPHVFEALVTNQLNNPSVRGVIVNARDVSGFEQEKSVRASSSDPVSELSRSLSELLQRAEKLAEKSDTIELLRGAQKQVLNLSASVSAQQSRTGRIRCHVRKLLREAITMTQHLWESVTPAGVRRFSLSLIGAERTLPVLADSNELRDVLIAMLLIGAEGVPSGGRIDVAWDVSEENTLSLRVSDSGKVPVRSALVLESKIAERFGASLHYASRREDVEGNQSELKIKLAP